MKRNHLWVTAIATVAFIFSLAACKKDSRLDPSISETIQPDSSKVYMPIKLVGSNITTIYDYAPYNAGILNSITKKEYTHGLTVSDSSYSVLYNDLNQPQHFSAFVNGVGISITQYSLNANDEVIRGDVYNVKPENYGAWGDIYVPTTLKSYYTLTYNNSKQLTRVSYFHADGQKDYDEFFEYTSEGNISAIHSPGTTNLEYDDFNGIGKSVKNAHLFYIEARDSLLFFIKNNPTKLNETSRTYKYNIDKYPVGMTVKHPDGNNEFKILYRLK